jgi:hypothetical protein
MLNTRAAKNQRTILCSSPMPSRVPTNSREPEPMVHARKYATLLRTQDWVDGVCTHSNQLVRSIQFVSENNNEIRTWLLENNRPPLILSTSSPVTVTQVVSENGDMSAIQLPPSVIPALDPDFGQVRSRLALNR